jgi:hypothetical protein
VLRFPLFSDPYFGPTFFLLRFFSRPALLSCLIFSSPLPCLFLYSFPMHYTYRDFSLSVPSSFILS